MNEEISKEDPSPQQPLGAAADGQNGKDSGDDFEKEEQMAQFEEALKETDWGHQPC